jgi:N-terminal domain of toast_rack, DUF2154
MGAIYMKKPFFLALIIGSLLTVTSGCNLIDKGKVKEESISVKKDKAKELDVELNLGLGELTVTKGAKNWIDGSIKYNDKHLKPKVSYELNGSTGKVEVDQVNKRSSKVEIDKKTNEWDLELTNKVPLNLEVNTGAAKTNLDLRGLNLKNLDIETGVGELNVNLGGNWEKSFEADVQTGVGKTTIILPVDIGVKIISSKGIGKANAVDFISKGDGVYVNEAYKNAKEVITVNMELGVGEVTFKLD